MWLSGDVRLLVTYRCAEMEASETLVSMLRALQLRKLIRLSDPPVVKSRFQELTILCNSRRRLSISAIQEQARRRASSSRSFRLAQRRESVVGRVADTTLTDPDINHNPSRAQDYPGNGSSQRYSSPSARR